MSNATKRPSDAETVRFLRRAALFLSAMTDAAPEYSATREEGLSLVDGARGFADALEAASAETSSTKGLPPRAAPPPPPPRPNVEPFEAKVTKALATFHSSQDMAFGDYSERDSMTAALRAAGVEG